MADPILGEMTKIINQISNPIPNEHFKAQLDLNMLDETILQPTDIVAPVSVVM